VPISCSIVEGKTELNVECYMSIGARTGLSRCLTLVSKESTSAKETFILLLQRAVNSHARFGCANL
jgi:hypothetical protein